MVAELVLGAEAGGAPQDSEQQRQRRDIRVRDAGAVLQLLNLPLDGDDDATTTIADMFPGGVPSREVLRKVADACTLVVLLQDALLPSLRRAPADAAHLLVADACAQKLGGYARGVGGVVAVACAEFVRRVESYTADARGRPGNSADDGLIGQAGRFLDMTCTPDEAAAWLVVQSSSDFVDGSCCY